MRQEMHKETEDRIKTVARYLQPRVCENCGRVILNNNRKFCSNDCYLKVSNGELGAVLTTS